MKSNLKILRAASGASVEFPSPSTEDQGTPSRDMTFLTPREASTRTRPSDVEARKAALKTVR
jgi:hypothetical protein